MEFKKIDTQIKSLDLVSKIFGIKSELKEREIALNLLIQLAQKCIWKTRNSFERKNKHENIWIDFKKNLLYLMLNLKKMIPPYVFDDFFIKNKIVKISRYKLTLQF